MIRHMTAEDTDDIVSLMIAAGMFSAEEAEVVRGLLRDYVEARHREHVCVVDDYEGRLVGVAYYQPKGPGDRLWQLTMIAVHPDLQGTGRGGALLHHVEGDLRSRGQRLLTIDTSGTPQYDRARAFYARCHYAEEARIRDYWQDGDDLVVFTKRLDG
jgi:ribosomal protein S18 acetylase RimI-like enzyme